MTTEITFSKFWADYTLCQEQIVHWRKCSDLLLNFIIIIIITIVVSYFGYNLNKKIT